MQSEHDLQNLIRLELSKLGWITFRINVGKVKMVDGRWFNTGLPVGFSDLIALNQGKLVFLEVKTKKGVKGPKQKEFIKKMQQNGFVADFVYSVEDAKKLVNGGEK